MITFFHSGAYSEIRWGASHSGGGDKASFVPSPEYASVYAACPFRALYSYNCAHNSGIFCTTLLLINIFYSERMARNRNELADFHGKIREHVFINTIDKYTMGRDFLSEHFLLYFDVMFLMFISDRLLIHYLCTGFKVN